MNFDLVWYLKTLASKQKRFTFQEWGNELVSNTPYFPRLGIAEVKIHAGWSFWDSCRKMEISSNSTLYDLWGFFGTLLEDFNIKSISNKVPETTCLTEMLLTAVVNVYIHGIYS